MLKVKNTQVSFPVITCKHDCITIIIGKDYSDLSSCHQRHRKAEIHNDIQKYVSNPLFSIGLTVETVQLKDINTNNLFKIRVSNSAPQPEPTGEVTKEGAYILFAFKIWSSILEILS